MPSAIEAMEPDPSSPSTFPQYSSHSGAMPRTPIPFTIAAIMPQTCVEWPATTSYGVSDIEKSFHAVTFRSRCCGQPVSRTATRTPSPLLRFHISGMFSIWWL